MTTTATTTLSQRLNQMAAAESAAAAALRTDLASYAATQSTDALMRLVQNIAEHEEAASVYAQATRVPRGSLQDWIVQTALLSTDDTWSGRGNDLRRLVADSRRTALDRINLARETARD